MAYENAMRFIDDVSLENHAIIKFHPEKMTKAERDALTGSDLYDFRIVAVTDLNTICYWSATDGKWVAWTSIYEGLKAKGTIGTSTSTVTSKIFPEDAEKGDFYIVAEDGEYSSKDGVTKKYARKGDWLFCITVADTTASKSPVFELSENGNGTLSADLTKETDKVEYSVTNSLKSKNIHCSLYEVGTTDDEKVLSKIKVSADEIKVVIGSAITVGTKYRLDVIYG